MNFKKLNEIHFHNDIRQKNKLLLRPTKSTGELKETIPTACDNFIARFYCHIVCGSKFLDVVPDIKVNN